MRLSATFIGIPRQRGGGRVPFTEAELTAMRGGLTAEQYLLKLRAGETRLISMEDLDRRTKAAQMALETKDAIMADLGGTDRLSTMERLMAEHAALAAAVTQDAYARWLK